MNKNQHETHDFRLERRLDLAVLDFLPVDSPEEEVTPNVVLPFVAAAKPLGGVLRQELKEGKVD